MVYKIKDTIWKGWNSQKRINSESSFIINLIYLTLPQTYWRERRNMSRYRRWSGSSSEGFSLKWLSKILAKIVKCNPKEWTMKPKVKACLKRGLRGSWPKFIQRKCLCLGLFYLGERKTRFYRTFATNVQLVSWKLG